MRSLFLAALPRSLTTLVYRLSSTSLNLTQPAWTTDGEILNADHLALVHGGTNTDGRFVTQDNGHAQFQRLQNFLLDVVQEEGHAYKDVVQPFVTATSLAQLELAKLYLRRPIADVALAMIGRGWTYPAAAAQSHDGEQGLIEGLIRAASALEGSATITTGSETLDFDDLVSDERHLSDALRRLFPESEFAPLAYMDGAFRRRHALLAERRQTAGYRRMASLVDEVAETIGIALPEPWTGPSAKSGKPPVPTDSRGPSKAKPVILIVGDAVAPTGFARVTQSIVSRLQDVFDFHQLGINFSGDPHGFPWPIYPAGLGGDPHGVNRIAELVVKIRPDVILLVNDLWIIGDYLKALDGVAHNARLVAYIPIDAGPLVRDMVTRITGLDLIVVYTEFAARLMDAAGASATERDASFSLPPVEIIPHGVDTGIFFPLFSLDRDLFEGRKSVRRSLLPGDEDFQNAFIVLNANRNQPRKRIDTCIEGFGRFAADKPDSVKLYLHMGTVDQGWDIHELARRNGIGSRLIMSHGDAGPPALDVAQLNRMYNACDVGINTAEGEGWGLPAFEHAATGAAQIVPGHSGPASIWADAAELLEVSHRVTNPGMMTDAQLVSADAVANALERLYSDRVLLRERSLAAHRHATQEHFSWDNIAARFEHLISKVLASHP